ncbi:hypothetical protein [Robbsia sp. KACC 23696]|uniref:hypothetical protein n=1 Tax=Robbsia sp. KACC 23696 TaxID=3149231 RepID=UPI00325BC342
MICHFPHARAPVSRRCAAAALLAAAASILLSACGTTTDVASRNPVMTSAPIADLPPIYLQSTREADDVARCVSQRLFTRVQKVDTPRGPAQLIRTDGWDIVIKQQDNGATLVAGDYRDNAKRQGERNEPTVRFAVARCTI